MYSKSAVIIALVFINLTQSSTDEDDRALKDIPIVDKLVEVLQTLPGTSGFIPVESNTNASEVSLTSGFGTSFGPSTTSQFGINICSCDYQTIDFCQVIPYTVTTTPTHFQYYGVDTAW